MNLKFVKEMIKYAESLGLKCEAKQRGSTHIGVRATRPDGETKLFILSASPSAPSTRVNARADFKRFARTPPKE